MGADRATLRSATGFQRTTENQSPLGPCATPDSLLLSMTYWEHIQRTLLALVDDKQDLWQWISISKTKASQQVII